MTSAELQSKFTDFMNQHRGGKVKTATAYNGKDSGPYQCVEEPKAFLEFVGLKSGAYGNAIKWWYSTAAYLLSVCDKVSGTNVQAADIVVLESNKNPIVKGSGEGHIGQATGNQTATEFEIFEQNGSTGNGSGTGNDALRTRMVPKSRIAGILRIKTTSPPSTPTPSSTGKRVYFDPIGQVATFYKVSGGTFAMKIKDSSYNWNVIKDEGNRVLVYSASAGGNCWVYMKYTATGNAIPGRYVK